MTALSAGVIKAAHRKGTRRGVSTAGAWPIFLPSSIGKQSALVPEIFARAHPDANTKAAVMMRLDPTDFDLRKLRDTETFTKPSAKRSQSHSRVIPVLAICNPKADHDQGVSGTSSNKRECAKSLRLKILPATC
jgi:hypothetical protein